MMQVPDLLQERLAALPVAVVLPDGQRVGARDARVVLRVHSTAGVAALAALARGHIGRLGAAVVEGLVEVEGRMRDAMAAAAVLAPADPLHVSGGWFGRTFARIAARMRSSARHTPERDAHQVRFHYDISDEFYALWLDPQRVYSCAYFQSPDATLAQAQQAKLDLICRKLDLRAGERLLDIGSGWGALLLWAAEHYGVTACGITLSQNQYQYVQRLIEEKGLGGRVQVQLRDWRDMLEAGPFDKVVSVGMFEHVGRAHMPEYFATIHRLLRPGALALVHGITAGATDNLRVGAGMGEFIGQYIFPGGELMHVSHVLHEMARGALEMVDTENLRPHYARTLWCWSDALEAQLPRAQRILRARLGQAQAQRVLRAWRLYLAGCALGFERGWVAVHQMLCARPDPHCATPGMPGAQSVYPFGRGYMYT